eukprot:Rhum_TRINITY_DN14547_c6_g1::Rhum_TRINITY_DN14547_c6_g1_i1::g.96394::m.96394
MTQKEVSNKKFFFRTYFCKNGVRQEPSRSKKKIFLKKSHVLFRITPECFFPLFCSSVWPAKYRRHEVRCYSIRGRLSVGVCVCVYTRVCVRARERERERVRERRAGVMVVAFFCFPPPPTQSPVPLCLLHVLQSSCSPSTLSSLYPTTSCCCCLLPPPPPLNFPPPPSFPLSVHFFSFFQSSISFFISFVFFPAILFILCWRTEVWMQQADSLPPIAPPHLLPPLIHLPTPQSCSAPLPTPQRNKTIAKKGTANKEKRKIKEKKEKKSSFSYTQSRRFVSRFCKHEEQSTRKKNEEQEETHTANTSAKRQNEHTMAIAR